MPVMNGYETMAAIRLASRLRTTADHRRDAKVNPGERERCMEAGASAYIPKPVDTAELLAALDPWFPASRALAAQVHEADVAAVTERSDVEVARPGPTATILVVDDNFGKRLAMIAVLEGSGTRRSRRVRGRRPCEQC